MWNIKALALTVQKLLARLKFQRGWQTGRKQYDPHPQSSILCAIEVQISQKIHPSNYSYPSTPWNDEVTIDLYFRPVAHLCWTEPLSAYSLFLAPPQL